MNRPIKVLMIVTNLGTSNGVTSYVMNYFRKVDKSRIHIDFAILSDIPSPYYQEIDNAGSNVFVLPSYKNPIKHYIACKRILQVGQYDIVHDNILLPSIIMMLVAKKNSVPVRILHSHNSRLGETWAKERRNKIMLPILKHSVTDNFACSKIAAEAMFGSSEYSFIPNTISTRLFSYSSDARTQLRNKMGLKDKIVIGTVGRLVPQKNPFFALDIVRLLINLNLNIEYWWIGSGPLDKEFKNAVIEKGIENNVVIMGSRDDVPDLYQAMDVFFLPSIFEGLPVTGVEAQAMGLPVVMSDSITKEMIYTDLVESVSLDASTEDWLGAFRKQITRISGRRSYSEELQSSCFSDKNAGAYLEKLYIKLEQKSDFKR